MALLYLNAIPSVELLGITTILGNAPIEVCTRNALILCERYGIDVPVYRGSESSVTGQVPGVYPDFVHGTDGLGELDLPEPVKRVEDQPAFEYLVEAVSSHPREITILAVGRLTNLALAINAQPDFQDLVKEVIIMGGAVNVPGNVTRWAEANIMGDPEAADVVFRSHLNLTMVGLDVTNATRMSMRYIESLFSDLPDLSDFILAMNSYYADFYLRSEATDDFPVHDSSAVAFLDDAKAFDTSAGRLHCILDGDERGRTVFQETESTRHRVCLEVDSDRLLQNYAGRIGSEYRR